jgi:hypothetical protein
MEVYRVQPVGLDLANHKSETSNGESDCGVHVFLSLEELQGAVNGWCSQDYTPEIFADLCRDYEVSL